MQHFSSISHLKWKFVLSFMITLALVCPSLPVQGNDSTSRLLYFSKADTACAKTILSSGNTTSSDAVSMEKNISYESTVAPREVRYYSLSGEEIYGDIILRIKAEQTPSFSFHMTNMSGDTYKPSVYEYSPSTYLTKIIYHFSWKQKYNFTVQNLQDETITYSIQYTKNEAKIKSQKSKRTQKPSHSTKKNRKSITTPKPTYTPNTTIKHSYNPNKSATTSKRNHNSNNSTNKSTTSKRSYNSNKSATTSKRKHNSNKSTNKSTTSKPSKKQNKSTPETVTLSHSFLRIHSGDTFQITASSNSKFSLEWVIYQRNGLSSQKITGTKNHSTFSARAIKEGTIVIVCKSKNTSASCTVKVT